MATTYRIVLSGIASGVAQDLAVKKLAAVFKTPDASIQTLVGSTRHVVKAGVDIQTAAKYEGAIRECGWVVVVEPEAPSPAPM